MATIKSQFDQDDKAIGRQSQLRIAEECASLTKPWIQPPSGQTAGDLFPDTEQSLGARGIANLEGRLLLALYPPNQSWFILELSPEIKNDFDPEQVRAWEDALFMQQLVIQTKLESSAMQRRARRRAGFRSRKRMALAQLLVTGDVLEQLTSDYRLKVFRRDQYVTQRDSAGDVLYHIIKEQVDPLSLSEEMFEKTQLSIDEDTPVFKRMADLYTYIEWQPRVKNWLIRQEVNNHTVAETTEDISPYFSTAYDLPASEHYGRGFCEANLGDLRSHNAMRKAKLDHAGLASKMLFAMDYSSNVVEEDLTQESGGTFRAKVTNGRIDDVGILNVQKVADFQVVQAADADIRVDLARAMLLESEIQPQQERVTAAQIHRIALELEGTLGGAYTPVADDQQIPLIQRTMFQLEKEDLIENLPDNSIDVTLTTGLAALGSQVRIAKLLSFAEIVVRLGEEASRRLNMGVLIEVLRRWSQIEDPRVIKTEEQIRQEDAEKRRQLIQASAQQQVIQSSGAIAETTAASQAEAGAAPPETTPPEPIPEEEMEAAA